MTIPATIPESAPQNPIRIDSNANNQKHFSASHSERFLQPDFLRAFHHGNDERVDNAERRGQKRDKSKQVQPDLHYADGVVSSLLLVGKRLAVKAFFLELLFNFLDLLFVRSIRAGK